MKTLEQHQRVYDPDGIAPTLFTPHGSDKSPKIIERGGQLILHGNLDTSFESQGRVYDPLGIAPTILTDHQPKIIERRTDD